MAIDIGSAVAHVIGGGLKGFAEGTILDIREERNRQHAEMERKFRTSEREASQTFASGEREASERFRAGEAGADRRHQTSQTVLQNELAGKRESEARREQHGFDMEKLKSKADIDKLALGGQLDKAEVGGDGNYVLFMRDGTIKQTQVKGVPKGESGAPVKIFDPNSPTGESYTTPSQAVGKPAPPPSSTRVESDGKGGFVFEQGGKAGAGGLTPKTKGELEERQLNAAEQLSRLDDIKASWDPSHQQLKPRGKAAWSSMKDFMGVDLSPADTESLTKFTQSKQVATDNLNKGIKEATGSAMGVEEAKRIIAAMPNPGTGLFDGDSPTVFKAKLDKAIEMNRNALIRFSYAKNNGLDPLKTGIELQDVPALVQRRGGEIRTELETSNPGATQQALNLALRERLRLEFGIK